MSVIVHNGGARSVVVVRERTIHAPVQVANTVVVTDQGADVGAIVETVRTTNVSSPGVQGRPGDGMHWVAISVPTPMQADTGYLVDASAGTIDLTLPVNVPLGFASAANARGGQVRIVSNGNVIDGVGAGNDLLITDGNTVSLAANAVGELEILFGTYANEPSLSKGMTYDVLGRLSTVSDSTGTKTLTYNGAGQLIALVGTGAYRSKTFTYDGSGELTAVTITS